MKRLALLALLIGIGSIGLMAQMPVPQDIAPIEAPFDMPQLQRPLFADRTVRIDKAGAKPGKLATAAIQKAIDRLAKKGGGTVVVPAGKWLTGRLTLRSGINLRLERDAELHFSGQIKDYLPVVFCRNEGVDVMSLGAMIYADGAENIGITGEGKLVAPPRDCEIMQHAMGGVSEKLQDMTLEERVFDGSNGGQVCLPVFIGPMNSKNVLIEGVTLEKSLFWNIVPCYCENIIIRGCTVNSHGQVRTDGIDIDSSENALIEYTTLDCGDDCFTIKSGRGMDGVRRNRPTRNVVVRNCLAKRGVGAMTFGSETAAGIENVYTCDLMVEGAKRGLYFKTRRPRGGGGKNLFFERIHMKRVQQYAIQFDMLGSAAHVGAAASRHPAPAINALTPYYHDIHFKDIQIDQCGMFVQAQGLPERPIENITFENVKTPNSLMSLQDVGTMTFK